MQIFHHQEMMRGLVPLQLCSRTTHVHTFSRAVKTGEAREVRLGEWGSWKGAAFLLHKQPLVASGMPVPAAASSWDLIKL